MRRSSTSSAAEDHLLSLVWGLWAELGVAGWKRSHQEFAIDPEILVLLTAWLHDLDPRLRDETTDWCIRYGHFISVARLKNLQRSSHWAGGERWSEFAATVNANSPWRWPASEIQPRNFTPAGKSRIENFGRPSLIYLRVRALVGVGARAEIVRLFSSEPHTRIGVAQIAEQIGYSKRNTAEALDGLGKGGLLGSTRVRNRLEYAVTDPRRLAALVGPRPQWFPVWVSVASVMTTVLDFLRRVEGLPESVASVESVTLVGRLADDLADWGVPAPQLVEVDEPAYHLVVRWSLDLFAALAAGDPRVLAGRQSVEGFQQERLSVTPGA